MYLFTRISRSTLLACALFAFLAAGTTHAQPVFDAQGESFDVVVGAVFMSDVSVLANDSVEPGDSLIAELVSPPSAGTLTFRADGTFDYDPAGAAGMQVFSYRAATLPTQRLTLVPEESVLRFDVEIKPEQLAAQQDTEDVVFTGELDIDLGPEGASTDPVQIRGLNAVNRDLVSLLFDWGEIIGTLTVEADPDSLILELRQVGPAVSADIGDGSFIQTGNVLGITVVADISATGFIAGSIEDGTRILATETAFDLPGTVDVGAPIVIEFEVATFNVFDLEGNDVTVETSGTLRATGQPVIRAYSDPVDVVLNIADDTDVENSDLPRDVRLSAVYPNPASRRATILMSAAPGAPRTAELVDVLGRTVRSVPITGSRTDVDVSGLAAGVYLVRLSDDRSRVLTLTVR